MLRRVVRIGVLRSHQYFHSAYTLSSCTHHRSSSSFPDIAAEMDKIKSTIAENLGGPSNKLVQPEHRFALDQVPSQTGKVGVITGGSEGIGYGVSHTLLSKDISKLFILSLSKEVVENATEAIREELGDKIASRVKWIHCDMSDWTKVATVATEISKNTDRLDILVNNAARGIMTYQHDPHGVDRHMSVGHIGHFILTSHLLPLMKKTANVGSKVRIVNQASNLHESAPKDTKFESLDELNQDLGPNAQYGRAKLAAILSARYLARHTTAAHPNLLINATHPGVVLTKMSTEDIHEPYPLGGYAMSTALKPFKKDQWEGALSALFAATVTEKSGEYICPPAVPEKGSDLSNNEELGEQLIKLTQEIVTNMLDPQKKGCPMTTS